MSVKLLPILLLLPAFGFSQALPSVFETLLGHERWISYGGDNDGLQSRTEKVFTAGLDGKIVKVKTYNVDPKTGDFGLRNEGVRFWEAAEKKWFFHEYDKYGGLTTGSVTASGKNLYYDYEYEGQNIRDAWEYVDERTYKLTVGTIGEKGDWARTYQVTNFTAAPPEKTPKGWRVIYAHDKEGQPLSGSLDDLREAVKSGQEIRLNWHHQRPGVSVPAVDHYAEAKFLTILQGNHVIAQIDPIVGQTPDVEAEIITFKAQLEWTILASTSGQHYTLMRNYATGEVINQRLNPMPMRWMVRN